MNRRISKLFHYKSEGHARRILAKLRKAHPDTTFDARLREDWRFYIWAQRRDGTGGWVKRVSHSAIEAVIPNDSPKENES